MLSSIDKALALRASHLFSGIAADALLPMAAVCTERQLETREALFEIGELGDALYVIASGTVQVRRPGSLVTNLGPGDCVGEMAAIDWEPRSATVVAAEPCLLVRLGRNELQDLLGRYPAIVRNLALVLVDRIRKMQT